MEKKQNVPALRFQGFSGEWKKKRLEEMGASFSYGLNAAATTYDGQHKYLRITDIDDESRKFSGKELTSPNVDLSNASDYLDYKLQENDIVFARTGASVGKTYLYDTSDGDVYYAGFLIRVKIDSKYDANFIFQKTLTSDYSHFVVVTSQRSGQPGINAQEYANLEMLVPELNEQKKIGRFLTDFDKNIFVCREKIQKLQQFRQAMLAKLFPREGAAEPELRFRGFSGKWERRNLLENFRRIIDFRGRTPKKLGMDWSTEGYLALSALNVKDGYIDFKQECHYGSQELYDKWMTGNELHKGQVVFTTEAPMGNVAQIPDDKKYILSQRTIAFEVKPDLINEDFLATLLRTPQMLQKLSALSSGGTAKGISQRSMEMVEAFFPTDILEQEKIGAFFKNLDSIISLQQKKLERMQQLKAALLEKLFV